MGINEEARVVVIEQESNETHTCRVYAETAPSDIGLPETREPPTEDVQTDEKNDLPVDRGWAWVVLAAATVYLILFGGIRKNFGIFFVAFQTRFDSTASLTSLLTTTQSLVFSVASLLVMTIGMSRMSQRTSVMIGGLLLTISNLMTAFSTDIHVLFLSYGTIEGIAMAMVHPTITSIIAEYFNKRRGLANGIAFSGANFGALVFAPIMTTLFDFYGFSGTLMLVAGMTLNIVVCGSLMRPIKSFGRPKKLRQNRKVTSGQATEIARLCQSETNVNFGGKDTQNSREICLPVNGKRKYPISKDPNLFIAKIPIFERSDSYSPDKTVLKMEGLSPLLPRLRTYSEGTRTSRTISEPVNKDLKPLHALVESVSKSNAALFASTEGFCASVVDISSKHQMSSVKSEDEVHKSCLSDTKTTLVANLKILFDIGLLKNPFFRMFMLVVLMAGPTSIFLPACIVPLSKDIGLSNREAGVLMSVIGGSGMFSRLTMAYLVDRKFIRTTTLLGGMSLIVGLSAQYVRFLPNFGALAAFAVVLGLCCELFHSMYTLVIVEYLTLGKLKSSVGFTYLCKGIANSFVFPIVGYLRDITGNYYASYHLLGSMSIAAGVLFLLLPIVNKWNQSKKAEPESKS